MKKHVYYGLLALLLGFACAKKKKTPDNTAQVQTLQEQYDALKAKFDTWVASLGNLAPNLATLTQNDADLQTLVLAILAQQDQSQQQNEKAVEDLQVSLTSLTDKVESASTQTDVSALQGVVGTVQSDLEQVKTQIATLSTRFVDLSPVENELGGLQTALQALTVQVGAGQGDLQAQINTLTNALTALSSTIQDHDAKMNALKTQADQLQADFTTFQQNVANDKNITQQQIDALTLNVQTLTSALASLQTIAQSLEKNIHIKGARILELNEGRITADIIFSGASGVNFTPSRAVNLELRLANYKNSDGSDKPIKIMVSLADSLVYEQNYDKIDSDILTIPISMYLKKYYANISKRALDITATELQATEIEGKTSLYKLGFTIDPFAIYSVADLMTVGYKMSANLQNGTTFTFRRNLTLTDADIVDGGKGGHQILPIFSGLIDGNYKTINITYTRNGAFQGFISQYNGVSASGFAIKNLQIVYEKLYANHPLDFGAFITLAGASSSYQNINVVIKDLEVIARNYSHFIHFMNTSSSRMLGLNNIYVKAMVNSLNVSSGHPNGFCWDVLYPTAGPSGIVVVNKGVSSSGLWLGSGTRDALRNAYYYYENPVELLGNFSNCFPISNADKNNPMSYPSISDFSTNWEFDDEGFPKIKGF